MQIDTIRFGQVEIDEKKILCFQDGLPGLESYTRFAILQFEESGPIIWLQSVEDGGICLPVVDTFSVAPEYAFDLADGDVKNLELAGPEDLHIISVLVIPEDITQMTINLAAPIVVNMRTGQAKQVILGGGDYNVRAPIFPAICRLIKEEEAAPGKEEKTNVGSVKEDQ